MCTNRRDGNEFCTQLYVCLFLHSPSQRCRLNALSLPFPFNRIIRRCFSLHFSVNVVTVYMKHILFLCQLFPLPCDIHLPLPCELETYSCNDQPNEQYLLCDCFYVKHYLLVYLRASELHFWLLVLTRTCFHTHRYFSCSLDNIFSSLSVSCFSLNLLIVSLEHSYVRGFLPSLLFNCVLSLCAERQGEATSASACPVACSLPRDWFMLNRTETVAGEQ